MWFAEAFEVGLDIPLEIAAGHGCRPRHLRRDIGTTIVAEGIETSAEFDVLAGLGVAYGQGYHLGRPKPLPLRNSRAAIAFEDGVLSDGHG